MVEVEIVKGERRDNLLKPEYVHDEGADKQGDTPAAEYDGRMVLVVARWRWLDTTAQDMVAKVTTSLEEEMIMKVDMGWEKVGEGGGW